MKCFWAMAGLGVLSPISAESLDTMLARTVGRAAYGYGFIIQSCPVGKERKQMRAEKQALVQAYAELLKLDASLPPLEQYAFERTRCERAAHRVHNALKNKQ